MTSGSMACCPCSSIILSASHAMVLNDQAPAVFSDAMRKILIALGRERCSAIARRSSALIYKWSDSSWHYYPNLHQALLLDKEFVHHDFGAPPLLTAYLSLLSRRV